MTQKDSEIEQASTPQRDDQVAGLTSILAAFAAKSAGSAAGMRTLQKSDPGRFARAAVRLLGSAEPSHGLKVVAQFVASDRLIIDVLLLNDKVPLSEALVATRRIVDVEANFEVLMIRKVFQDFVEVDHVPAPVALRLLELVGHASSCSKLTPLLIRFVQHPSKQVRSKSVLLLGRGNLNLKRTLDYLSNSEARVRANAVESLWDHKDADTNRIFLAWSQDPNSRVMVNALVGLCRLGDSNAPARLAALADSGDAVTRAGSAWGMGQVVRPDVLILFTVALDRLAGDSDQKVQIMARASLEKLTSQKMAGTEGGCADGTPSPK
jgi:hypothetical protein